MSQEERHAVYAIAAYAKPLEHYHVIRYMYYNHTLTSLNLFSVIGAGLKYLVYVNYRCN